MADGIDAHVARRRAECFLSTERIGDILARGILLVRRDAVLDIQHDRIGVETKRLVDHPLPVSRHKHP